MRQRTFEVVIIGGGPAGAICAFMLARRGARVCLVNRAGHLSGCTELVSGRARRLIEQHCPSFFEWAPGVEIHETISLWGTPEPVTWNAMFNPWGPGVAVEREPFDEGLRGVAQRAGALVLPGEIRDAERRCGMWHLLLKDGAEEYVLTSEFLVLATGSTGRKLVGRKAGGRPAQFALMAQIRTTAQEQCHALFLEQGKEGWWYMLPTPAGGYFAGFCTDHTFVNHSKERLRNKFVTGLRDSRLLADVLSHTLFDSKVTACGAGPRRYQEVTGEGWIAIGDAAFTPDPLSGAGLEFAIESSLLAVGVLLEGAQSQSSRNYQDHIQDYATNHERIRDMHLASAEIHTS
ncbi:MAG: NAD(P)/FAD-dependent oxidoreductase [Pyrinomonadaceae bacterium]